VRVLVLTGAGVSAESGIPTFRGKDGYWRNLDPTKLATPEAFARDPQLVWDWYRERRGQIRSARPNAAHESIARLAQHTEEFLLVTQNVDDLHTRTGIPRKEWCKFMATFSLRAVAM
jgi:NAD-dependent deacetylase